MDEADFRGPVRRALDRVLWRAGYHLQRLRPETRRRFESSYDTSVPLPPEAAQYLRADNPRLLELRQAYAALGWPVCSESFFWSPERMRTNVDLPWFRGDNAYVWQYRQLGASLRMKRYLILREVASRDPRGLLKSLGEDGLFGCWIENYPGWGAMSRDLLDSVNEINFLERQLNLSGMQQVRVLDIGAGYGRMAHRVTQALPNVTRYDCIDAVPESTFLSEFYLRFRGATPPARVVPLHKIEAELTPGNYDVALNIHSFPECTYAAIAWWLERVKVLQIPWLLIAPNHKEELLSTETDGSRRDFTSLVKDAGYELAVTEPVYQDPAARELIDVQDVYMLFRRRA